MFSADITWSIDCFLDLYLELLALELGEDLLASAGGVGLVDVDVVWFYVVGDCLVVLRFPEFGLAGRTVKEVSV